MGALYLASTTEGAQRTLDLLIVLATAAAVAIAARRLRLAAAPAYLIAGALLGPGALGVIDSPDRLDGPASFALVLLLFGVGMHMDLSSLRGAAGVLVGAAALSTALSTAVGWPVAMAFGLSPSAALAVSMALSVSVTSIVLKILSDKRELGRPHGRLAMAILVIQDLLVLVMLVALPVLAKWSGGGPSTAGLPGLASESGPDLPLGSEWPDLIGNAALKIGAAAAMVVFGKLVLPRLLSEAAKGRAADVMMVTATASALGAATLTHWLGFSAELGAFLAGFMLSGTPFRHQLAGQIGPLRDLFMAVFFTCVGMNLNVEVALANWWVVLAGCLAMIVVKSLTIGFACWAVGATAAVSVMVGPALAQAGEFSLVLLRGAREMEILDQPAMATLIAIAVLSLIVTPLLVQAGESLAPRFARAPSAPWVKRRKLQSLPHHEHDHEHAGPGEAGGGAGDPNAPETLAPRCKRVIIAGYGPAGRAVDEKLRPLGIETTIIELNPRTVQMQQSLGRRIVFGDISNAEVLESAGVREADAAVITIPDEQAALSACRVIRTLSPTIFIAARTDFLSKGMLARSLGADYVVVDEIATADAMQRALLDRFGGTRTDGRPISIFGVLRDEGGTKKT